MGRAIESKLQTNLLSELGEGNYSPFCQTPLDGHTHVESQGVL